MRSPFLIAAVAAVVVTACATDTQPSIGPGSPLGTPSRSVAQTLPPAASTAPPVTLSAEPIFQAITEDALVEHLAALQAIADAHGGTRATGTSGFEETVAYVAAELDAAGYDVDRLALDAAGVPSETLLVERPGAPGDEVVMLGAHLDSVTAGPGLNDNGSGVAALLVIAARLADLPPPHRTIRFAFWGAEEGGPFGSTDYVASLDREERDEIAAYLNFDMIGSPNAIRFVYDEAGAAAGSDAITRVFSSSLESAGLAWEPIDLEGDSDHGPFSEAGIATGGLFSGGIEPKTADQAVTFGGRAGEPADACSHRACDTIDNVDLSTLEEMADTIAEVLISLANADG